jgi:hypothetical protein
MSLAVNFRQILPSSNVMLLICGMPFDLDGISLLCNTQWFVL